MLKLRSVPRPDKAIVNRLYELAVSRSRNPDLYASMGAPDTVEGRFELLTTHIVILIERLDRAGDRGKAIGQALFDLYIRNLDGALREMGVGDLAVGKRMKGLGGLFYGRAAAYRRAFASGDIAELKAVIARTILVERPEVSPEILASYVLNEKSALDRLGDGELLSEARDAA